MKYNNWPDFDCDEDDPTAVIPFTVLLKGSDVAAARSYTAATARQAAERAAHDDYRGDPSWRGTYRVRDGLTGRIWDVVVGVVQEPSFVAIEAAEVPMPPAVHVMWGGRVLCEDLRLRGVPRDWPYGQSWISLADVATVERPTEPCQACWAKAPELTAELQQIGKDR